LLHCIGDGDFCLLKIVIENRTFFENLIVNWQIQYDGGNECKHTISSFLTFSIVTPSELFGEHSKSEASIISLELHVLQLLLL